MTTSAGLIDVDEGTAIDRKRDTGNEVRFIGRCKKSGVRDIPFGAHFMTQRYARHRGQPRPQPGSCRRQTSLFDHRIGASE